MKHNKTEENRGNKQQNKEKEGKGKRGNGRRKDKGKSKITDISQKKRKGGRGRE